jgi:TRAP-type C4-dicarboxylate transport system permease small subunit
MKNAISTIAAGWALAGGVLLLVITLVTTFNVGAFTLDRVGRTIGAPPVEGFAGYEDLVRLLISCAALMFFPYCQLKRGHVAVDLFTDQFPPALRDLLGRLWLVATAFLALFLGYWMTIGLFETRADATSTSILGWVEWPFYAPGIISMALWALIAAMQAFEPAEGELRGA